MKFFPTPRPERLRRAFTLAEVLAAMLVMAIVIPVALQGMSIASRAAMLGQRKATAMRVAERVLNELYVTSQLNQNTSGGTITEGDTSYPWTLQTKTWPLDSMSEATVSVTFTVQGSSYSISASTLFDPATSSSTSATSSSSSQSSS